MTDHIIAILGLVIAIPSFVIGWLAFAYGNMREMSKSGARRKVIRIQKTVRMFLLTRIDIPYSIAQIGIRLALILIGCTALIGFGILVGCSFFSIKPSLKSDFINCSMFFEIVGILLTFYNFTIIRYILNPIPSLARIRTQLLAIKRKHQEGIPEIEEALSLIRKTLDLCAVSVDR